MLLKTHLAFAFLAIILFMSYIDNSIVFVIALLLGTILPDVDTGFSSIGNKWYLKPLQFFVKHSGIIHSFTIAIILTILLGFFYPIACFGFFVGYGVHLLCDSFTSDGIRPFWPLRAKTSGFIRTGGRIEESIFVFLILINIITLVLIWII
jgi:inner membrane protein